jgi:hypothetical protein
LLKGIVNDKPKSKDCPVGTTGSITSTSGNDYQTDLTTQSAVKSFILPVLILDIDKPKQMQIKKQTATNTAW